MARLQRGKAGELAAEYWFKKHGWAMYRTQPPMEIVGILTGPMVSALSRFFNRLSFYGHMVIGRMGKGGIVDYTGHEGAIYRACEVKEAVGASMPASRLDKGQREFLSGVPTNCAFVGILWTDYSLFEIFPYLPKGSYKKGEGL
jgi:hypothetical protein